MQPVDQETVVYQYSRGSWKTQQSQVISEALVSLTVNGEIWLSFLCTPADLEALAVGFLFNEQIIQSQAEIVSTHVCANGDNVDVWINHPVQKPAHWQRTSGCGTGMAAAGVPSPASRPLEQARLSPDTLLNCMDLLKKSQVVYRQSRGIHASALTDGRQIFYQVEDIGRHNTLDKLAGYLILKPVPISPFIVLTTGRISLEMLNKSARMGADIILSRTSPTTRSIQQAALSGITLIGYARRAELIVYTHPQRILPGGDSQPGSSLPAGLLPVD